MSRKIASYTSSEMDAANEYTPMYFCGDAQHVVITLIAAGATATVKTYGAETEVGSSVERPSLSAVSSATNLYTPINIIDRDTGTSYDGSTGISRTGATTNNQSYEVNAAGLNWIGVKMTARTVGSVIVKVDMYDNR